MCAKSSALEDQLASLRAESQATMESLRKRCDELNASLSQRQSDLIKSQSDHQLLIEESTRIGQLHKAELEQARQLADEMRTRLAAKSDECVKLAEQAKTQAEQMRGELEVGSMKCAQTEAELKNERQENQRALERLESEAREREDCLAEAITRSSGLSVSLATAERSLLEAREQARKQAEELNSLAAERDRFTQKLEKASADLAGKIKDFDDLQQYVRGVQQVHADELAQYESELTAANSEKLATATELVEAKVKHDQEKKALYLEVVYKNSI